MALSIKSACRIGTLQRCICLVIAAFVLSSCAQKKSKSQQVEKGEMSNYFATADEAIDSSMTSAEEQLSESVTDDAVTNSEDGINPDVFAAAPEGVDVAEQVESEGEVVSENVDGDISPDDAETLEPVVTSPRKPKVSNFAPVLMAAEVQKDAQGLPIVDVNGQELVLLKVYDESLIAKQIYTLEQFGPNPYVQQAPMVTDDVKAAFADVVAMLEDGKSDAAETELQKLIDDQPLLSGPAYNMGVLKYEQKDLDKAAEYTKLALDRNYYNQDARNLAALIQREKGDFPKSAALHKENLKVWGGYAPAYRNLGILLDLYMGDFEAGLPYYHQYNALQDEQDRVVLGWTMDIERRLAAKQAAVEREKELEAQALAEQAEASNAEGIAIVTEEGAEPEAVSEVVMSEADISVGDAEQAADVSLESEEVVGQESGNE